VPRWMQVLSFTVGLALLVGAPVAWGLSRPQVSIGEVPAIAAEQDAASTTATARTEPGDRTAPGSAGDDAGLAGDPSSDVPATPVAQASATPSSSSATSAVEDEPESNLVTDPVRIRIDALEVDVPVVPVGLEDDGGMEVPEDAHEIGWYRPGVRPGEKGSAVLAGHVDSKEGPGAFWGLRDLGLDDVVTITHADGTERAWRVVAREQYLKAELPTDELFVWGGETEQLALITCGGSWNRDRGSYRDNIVVYAVPA
jgi:hypothetical protein